MGSARRGGRSVTVGARTSPGRARGGTSTRATRFTWRLPRPPRHHRQHQVHRRCEGPDGRTWRSDITSVWNRFKFVDEDDPVKTSRLKFIVGQVPPDATVKSITPPGKKPGRSNAGEWHTGDRTGLPRMSSGTSSASRTSTTAHRDVRGGHGRMPDVGKVTEPSMPRGRRFPGQDREGDPSAATSAPPTSGRREPGASRGYSSTRAPTPSASRSRTRPLQGQHAPRGLDRAGMGRSTTQRHDRQRPRARIPRYSDDEAG
jgi:hypothetical protein